MIPCIVEFKRIGLSSTITCEGIALRRRRLDKAVRMAWFPYISRLKLPPTTSCPKAGKPISRKSELELYEVRGLASYEAPSLADPGIAT